MRRRKVLFDDALALILAGGQGERLKPLTRDRSKPAVPFGGIYRIIDFTLSNCLNSGMRRIYVLTQYKSASLERHIKRGWDPIFSPELGEWVYTVPPQLRVGERWYQGTADAVYQNIYLIQQERPERVVILSGDHIYKMDYRKLVEYHEDKEAVATIGAVEMPIEQASAFGVVEVDDKWRVTSFKEKPAEPPRPIPGNPDRILVNMGVYCFETPSLLSALKDDAGQETRHDFGHNILPALIQGGQLYAYPFLDENRKPTRYWRDIGTLDSYYEASMDLVSVDPSFNLYDKEWPIRTLQEQLPPAKTVFAQLEKKDGRVGLALDSILGGGVIISGGRVERSVLSNEVRINSYALVEDSVLMAGVEVGRRARVRRAIIDKGIKIPPGYEIGFDLKEDCKRFDVTPGGIVVIPKGAVLR